MVDRAVLAKKLAAIRDAVARIREVLPDSAEAFRSDRTAREVVTLNLFSQDLKQVLDRDIALLPDTPSTQCLFLPLNL